MVAKKEKLEEGIKNLIETLPKSDEKIAKEIFNDFKQKASKCSLGDMTNEFEEMEAILETFSLINKTNS